LASNHSLLCSRIRTSAAGGSRTEKILDAFVNFRKSSKNAGNISQHLPAIRETINRRNIIWKSLKLCFAELLAFPLFPTTKH